MKWPRYRLRTLIILLAIGPPLIGFWPSIKRQALQRATQISASDIAVTAAASWLLAFRLRLHRGTLHSAHPLPGNHGGDECYPSERDERDPTTFC